MNTTLEQRRWKLNGISTKTNEVASALTPTPKTTQEYIQDIVQAGEPAIALIRQIKAAQAEQGDKGHGILFSPISHSKESFKSFIHRFQRQTLEAQNNPALKPSQLVLVDAVQGQRLEQYLGVLEVITLVDANDAIVGYGVNISYEPNDIGNMLTMYGTTTNGTTRDQRFIALAMAATAIGGSREHLRARQQFADSCSSGPNQISTALDGHILNTAALITAAATRDNQTIINNPRPYGRGFASFKS